MLAVWHGPTLSAGWTPHHPQSHTGVYLLRRPTQVKQTLFSFALCTAFPQCITAL